MVKKVTIPLTDESVAADGRGQSCLGYIYTARDAAHKRMMAPSTRVRNFLRREGGHQPYVGPAPQPGHVIGSVGPTTSGRMDTYARG